jgi:hypothetical protein
MAMFSVVGELERPSAPLLTERPVEMTGALGHASARLATWRAVTHGLFGRLINLGGRHEYIGLQVHKSARIDAQ